MTFNNLALKRVVLKIGLIKTTLRMVFFISAHALYIGFAHNWDGWRVSNMHDRRKRLRMTKRGFMARKYNNLQEEENWLIFSDNGTLNLSCLYHLFCIMFTGDTKTLLSWLHMFRCFNFVSVYIERCLPDSMIYMTFNSSNRFNRRHNSLICQTIVCFFSNK